MATGSTIDMLILVAVILLVLAVAVTAFWPPHRHMFLKIVNEHWDHEGHHYECRACVCGKTREFINLLEDAS